MYKKITQYQLYLGDDLYNYDNPLPCETLDQVKYYLDNAVGYDKYILLEYKKEWQQYEMVCTGRIELNRTHTRKGR